MQNDLALQQVIYDLFKTQIQFGMLRYGQSLPTIKEASNYFLASVDTVRLAYVRLKLEGYISLGTCVGAAVRVHYSEEDIRQHIQSYFSLRKSTLIAFAQSAKPLFGNAQWLAWKHISPETLDELERICLDRTVLTPYRMSRQLLLIYCGLGNDVLIRLIWQTFLFFQGPFLSVLENLAYYGKGRDPLLNMIRLRREENWIGLQAAFEAYEVQRLQALCQFFEDQAISEAEESDQIHFTWSIYKNTSQLCYSLCMDLLTDIGRDVYPVGSYLPSLSKLTAEKGVGQATVRRTISLLNKLGATQSINGVGTRILPPQDSDKNCDFSDAVIQKRLLDFGQSYQILALSCRACAQSTLEAMTPDEIDGWAEQLEEIRRSGLYEYLLSRCYEQIALHAPYPAIRSIYAELLRQFVWGHPLRNLYGSRDLTNAHFLPHLDRLQSCLHRGDISGFVASLERLQITETMSVVAYLSDLGIQEAALILISD